MTRNDLKTGMIVTTKNGREYVVLRDFANEVLNETDIMIRSNTEDDDWLRLSDYNDDFTFKSNHSCFAHWDIIKVEKANHPFGFMDVNYQRDSRVLLWKREKCKRLTVSEIENLLGYKVEIVSEEE